MDDDDNFIILTYSILLLLSYCYLILTG